MGACVSKNEKIVPEILLDTCSICLNSLGKNKICKPICKCNNIFYHKECIKTWLKKKSTCPICKEVIYSRKLNINKNNKVSFKKILHIEDL